ncbi:MAG: hypothetical protein OXC53_10840 [Rhodobacteraceae bacterium]|nr:hypothetical protein [Paracoccaceae bacterium]
MMRFIEGLVQYHAVCQFIFISPVIMDNVAGNDDLLDWQKPSDPFGRR